MKASVYTFFFSVLAAGLLFSSCAEEKEKQEEIPASNFRAEVSATPVRTAVSERRSFDYLINATGKVDALEEVLVVVERSGFLSELRVKEGDRVTKGQVLATLAPEEAAFKVEKAKIALRNALAKYESELLNFERIMEGDDEERKQFIQEQLKANSGVLIAEIELKEAERDFEKGEIVAPISGQVANVKLKQGAVASAGAELLEIVNTNSLELKVKVLESDISLLSLNQEAEIYPVSGGEMRVGTLRSLNPKVDENGLVQVGGADPESGYLTTGDECAGGDSCAPKQ
ncbi:efflux RND transporter periplasmic adaptor subunit [Nitritalea halalkaliphila]|uniref:efflux RND transporter periplasmic adaptor subunit n=1 Tax=Nitritalea halalkaliphila TaxID=590849 RepID=UPI0002D6E961|nr:efflux RND transporter periplasmic adaptor subunit [Nitritalea halalkaliphila]